VVFPDPGSPIIKIFMKITLSIIKFFAMYLNLIINDVNKSLFFLPQIWATIKLLLILIF